MLQNVSLGSNVVDWVRSLRKISTRLRSTNFCTSSVRFATSFVRQPNGPECTKIIRNVPKHHIRVQWGGLGVSLQKIRTRLHGTNFCISSTHFAPSFVRQPNVLKCTQMVWNAPKCQFRVQWGGSGAFVEKNSDATSFHELLHYFGPFCTKFRMATKQSRMLPNSTKHTKMLV